MQTLKARLESVTSALNELERRAGETATAVERLTAEKEVAARGEYEARKQAQRLAEKCAELEAHNAQLEERLAAVQRLLTNAEHDQRLLQVRRLLWFITFL